MSAKLAISSLKVFSLQIDMREFYLSKALLNARGQTKPTLFKQKITRETEDGRLRVVAME